MSASKQTAEPAGNTRKTADTIECAALGRPFQLGMLYDCRNDALIPGVTLWNQDNLQSNKSVQQQHNTEFNVTTSDSIEEKSNSLNISGSLKLSLLGGLVNVRGSAKYFQDTKKSHKQSRVTLQYRATTSFETLTMTHLARGQVSHPNVFEDDIATHVVTAILYGAGAYFMFDRESSSEDDRKQVEGDAKLTFDKLKFLKVDAEASLKMDDKEKAAVEKFSCTFHGDFQLKTNPTSFSDAVSVYRNLPDLLGENGEHAVPIRVWLYPLLKLDSRAAKLQRDISNDLITCSSDTIESLTMTEMRCSDILKDTAAATFPAMGKKVQTLMQKCRQYKHDFMQKLGSVLPSIRGGVKEESALADILKAHEQSPFNSNDLDQWLTCKEKESDALKSFLKQLEKLGAEMDDNLDDLLSDLEVKTIVCFSFTSVDQPDSFLVKLSDYLKPLGMVATPAESSDLHARNTEWLSTDARLTMRRQLRLFGELKKLNTKSTDTKFIAASKYDESRPGAWIFIYEDDCSDAVPFVPPSKPATPTITGVTHDSLTVKVSEPDSATVEYRVEYRMKQEQETEWASHPVQKNQEAVTLSGLKPGTEYEIRATAVGKLSYAVSSVVCSAVTLTAVGPPTQVKVTEETASSITLTWNIPSVQRCQSIKGYIIEFREENSNQWQRRDTGKEVYTFTLDNLKENMTYSIRMCTDVGVGVSQPGEEIQIKTKKAQPDMRRFTVLPGDNLLPPVYLLNLKPAEDGHPNKKVFGNPPTKKLSNKTIMVVGATGSGKTTLINGMINYVFGVEWEDNWRYKLIDEQTHTTKGCSQTSEVTAYEIHHTDGFKVPFSLTIIDTPGFGDTRGIKQDKEITDKIRHFLSVKGGIDTVDAVCFVVQSASARLTHTQKYIFDAILSIFGKDIATNIVILVTFADGQSPPVLEAIKAANIPCALNPSNGFSLHFKFNNSVLFVKHEENIFDTMLWNMGKASMNKFFTHLNTMKPQSLTLTKEVLEERRQLEATVEGVQPLIQAGLSKLEEINSTKATLQNHKTHMKENEDFDYEVIVDKSEKIGLPPGTFILNCHMCNYTCLYPCYIPKDADKSGCAVMRDGHCTVCPNKCHWNHHFSMTYRWEIKREPEKRTHLDLKKKYEEALGGKIATEKIITQLEVQYEQVQRKVAEMTETSSKSLQRLKEIALRPDPLATPGYIDILIETEKQEAKPGWQKRMKELQEVRDRAVLLEKLAEGVDLTGEEKATYDKMKSKVKGIFNNADSWFAS
ncbi:uncharacterized protein LOC105901965 isoform X2 [Clupea harengus]|nr:uncharacterized protein LOC105901965 isoform X2 [Clupea harengus]